MGFTLNAATERTLTLVIRVLSVVSLNGPAHATLPGAVGLEFCVTAFHQLTDVPMQDS